MSNQNHLKIKWNKKKVENLEKNYFIYDFDDKELKFKIFKLIVYEVKLNEIDQDLFEQIFGDTLIQLADKLINTTNKEENQIIDNSIRKNKYKLYEKDDFGDWIIQPSNQHINLKDAIDLILDFIEELN